MNVRCLPIEIGKFDKLAQMLDVLKINAIFTSRHLGEHILPLAANKEEAASAGRNADLLLKTADGWNAYNNLWRSAVRMLEKTLGKTRGEDRPLAGRKVLVFGTGRLAQTLVYGLLQRKGNVSVTGLTDDAQTLVYGLLQRKGNVSVTGLTDDDDDAIVFCAGCGAAQDAAINGAKQLADQFGVQYIPFSELQDAPAADVLVFADPALEMGYAETELNPSYLRAGMTVLDVRRMPESSDFIVEARLRGCKVVEPAEIYADQISGQFKAITGENLPSEALRAAWF
jgi:3-dehydroquinate dehydratase/shikimate dehydrogenase